MKKLIFWRFFIKAKNLEKAGQVRAIIMERFNTEVKELSFEIYWKDKTLFCLEIEEPLNFFDNKALVFEILTKISHFSPFWNMSLPSDFDLNLEFSGITNEKIQINNITWISFDLGEE